MANQGEPRRTKANQGELYRSAEKIDVNRAAEDELSAGKLAKWYNLETDLSIIPGAFEAFQCARVDAA